MRTPHLLSNLFIRLIFCFFHPIGAVAQDQYVQKLQNEVEKLKEELQTEQERNKNLQEEMEATLQDIQNM